MSKMVVTSLKSVVITRHGGSSLQEQKTELPLVWWKHHQPLLATAQILIESVQLIQWARTGAKSD